MDYIIETNSIEKKFKRHKALNNLNIHVPKGGIYGLIGRNGAGKTTLMRVICGLQKPTSGTYTINGISNKNIKINEERRKIGAIIEKPSVCLDMTADENLKEQYKIKGLKNYENLYEILKLVGLDKTGKKKVKNFSLGMKQRLGIAISLAGNTKILILDEPINGLDPQGIIEIRELILKLNREKNITFLISSHYLDELSKIATYYGFIDNGEILEETSKCELEKRLVKKTQITVTNLNECIKYLQENYNKYRVINNETLEIYETVNVSKLTIALSKRNCNINNFQTIEDTLENYYLNLTRRNKND